MGRAHRHIALALEAGEGVGREGDAVRLVGTGLVVAQGGLLQPGLHRQAIAVGVDEDEGAGATRPCRGNQAAQHGPELPGQHAGEGLAVGTP